MYANKPYIIAIPGDHWGSNYNLSNRDISFISENIELGSDIYNILNKNAYTFTSCFMPENITSGYYSLNDEGMNFIYHEDNDVIPFEGFLLPNIQQGNAPRNLNIITRTYLSLKKAEIFEENRIVKRLSNEGIIRNNNKSLYIYDLYGRLIRCMTPDDEEVKLPAGIYCIISK